jgi:hypothetical protein
MHRNYMRSLPREWRAMAKVFVALGDEHRQRILLTFEKGERLTVGWTIWFYPSRPQASACRNPSCCRHVCFPLCN